MCIGEVPDCSFHTEPGQHSSLCRLIPILGGLFSILDLTNIHLTHIVDPGNSAFEFLGDGLRNSHVL